MGNLSSFSVPHPTTMKAILVDKFVEKVEDVRISEVPNPEVKDGEVLVQIEAAGVNFVDLLY